VNSSCCYAILWHTVGLNASTTSRRGRHSVDVAGPRPQCDTITEPQAVLQWLIVTARREACAWSSVMTGRAEGLRGRRPRRTEHDIPEDLVLRTTARAAVQHIAQLPGRCRHCCVSSPSLIVRLRRVADSLGMPVGSIGPTRGRCLAKLRQQLANDPWWES